PIPGACSIIATQDDFDGRITPGHVDDYWIGYNEEGPDPWETSGVEHTWGDCTADFMGTNQWKWAFSGSKIDFNVDGSTALFSSGATKLYDYIPSASAGSPQTALCHGMRLFAESRGYTVTENYTQHVDTYAAGGFSFDDYKNEINNGYPVMIQVAGHSMVGIGYNESTQEIIIHDTWDNYQHRMDWGGSYESMLHQGVTVIHLEPASLLNNVHQVVLGADEDVNDINFGNNTTPGSISGYKFNDLDANGVWDDNEPGLQGWQIFVDLNQNYQFDAGEPNDITDENGAYSITGLYPGTYTIAEVNQPGWQQSYPAAADSALSQKGVRVIESVEITTTNSDSPIYIQGEVAQPVSGNTMGMMTQQSGSLINMDDFRNDPRFADIDGIGYCVVILDTGIDIDHPYFGPDNDSDGVADRIIFQYDFADGDFDASDQDGHGSNVSSIIGSQDSTNTGMAPGVNIIALKVFEDSGAGNFGYTEDALQWVINNAQAYNIVSVNMSLGDGENYNTTQSLYGIHDELTQLAAQGVIVVSSSGNGFYTHSSQQGIAYPAADEFSLSIGAVYDSGTSGYSYSSGAIAYTTDADRICPFSQRHSVLTTVFAPGAPITGANDANGTVTMHGTSQASPHIAGIAALAQQLAGELLGRQLGIDEFIQLIQNTAVTINDGDDEDDNVTNTNLDFPRVDMMALAEAIYDLGAETSGVHQVVLGSAENVDNVNFGNHSDSCGDWGYYEGDINGNCYVDYDDLAIIASTWLDGGAGDIDTDTDTDFRDYAILANQWLLCTDPQGLDCDNLLE
ncbi:MAG: S8 family serine peptidase, partial [Planctomycetes bacterium]|nr:S8 family serine peptidase [Planctomycetota bacterium]